MNTVPRVFAYLRRYPWLAAGTLACAIVGTLMIVIFPAVTKRVIDEVLIQQRPERLGPLILAAGLAVVLRNGLDSLRIILNNKFEERVIFDLPQRPLFAHPGAAAALVP
jgi:ABC-type bacteriocin/lantibiotic exporter with double-glycine peptidase domain